MKKRVRLTEGQLNRIIKESVKHILKEGYYDDGYDYYDDYDDYVFNRTYNTAMMVIDDIKNGLYDDKLDKLTNSDWVFDEFDINPGLGWDAAMQIVDSAHERKCIIDKNHALKYGYDNTCPHPSSLLHPSNSSYLAGKGNLNRFDYDRGRLNNNDWEEMERNNTLLNKVFTKKGGIRKNANNALNKALYGTDQYDKRSLHRKGSLNREL